MDIKILFTTNAIILLITLTILISHYKKNTQNKSIKFLTYFIALHFIGFMFFVLRNQIPDFFSIIVANMLFAVGTLFFYMSIRAIIKIEPIWYNRNYIPLLVFLIGFVIFTYISYDTKTRILIYYLFCAIFVFASGWLLWTKNALEFKFFDKTTAIMFFIISFVLIGIFLQATILKIETYYFSNKNIFMILSIVIIDLLSLWTLLALKYRIKN